MNKITFKILIIASAILFVGACTNIKNKESTETVYKANGDAVYPTIEGMIPHAVTVSDKGANETNYKVQLAVGKMMEVDCNQHSMNGEFEHEALEGYGYHYYVFKTNGNVASTMMACPDDTKTEKFVSGQDLFIPYNSKLTTPVYAPEGYEVRYTSWAVDNEYMSTQKPDESINPSAAQQLKYFPEMMEDYDRYVLYLPEEVDEESLRLEIMPGITKEVDCNTHWVIGDFETKEVEGMGYEYYVFKSDGDIASTRMACPDNKLTEKFVAANGQFGRYNSKISVVVFVPKGMELKTKTWKAQVSQVAEKL
ncbi:MAG: ecotin family protein [Dysgonamonadaceae bacterium]|nr:ecotin family protein [Dysgonamonadaceae bacterium]MDD4727729.1 ecotin family protein [Dysgonamonadaceae bacterium]